MTSLLGRVLDFYGRDPNRVFARVRDAREHVEPVTYSRLVLQAAGYAQELRRAGVGKGDVVVIVVRPGAELLSAWLAPLLLGAIPTIFPWPTEKLDRHYYEKSVAALLKISGAGALLTEDELLETLSPVAGDAANLRAIVTVQKIPPAATLPEVPRALREDAEAIAILQHSSGSTGLQKGVALSSRLIFHQLENHAAALSITESDRVVNWMPLYHDAGFVGGFLQPLLRGLPLTLLSPLDWVYNPVLLLRAITADRATLCWMPNFAYNFLARKIPDRQMPGLDLSSMRVFVNTAEPVRAASHEAFLTRFRTLGLRPETLMTSYGMAENTLAITMSRPGESVRQLDLDRGALWQDGVAAPAKEQEACVTLLSSGFPIPGSRVHVLDGKLRPLPERQVGQLAIQGNSLFDGYYRRPDLTAAAFHDGWYMTGDLGFLDGGEVFVTGRSKDLIIVGGNNIYPQDLEFLADNVNGVHPGRTAAFGVENETLGTEEVVILFEAEKGHDPRQVEDAVREAVARQSDCVARTVRAVPPMWLTKTSSGKISRARCREKFLAVFS